VGKLDKCCSFKLTGNMSRLRSVADCSIFYLHDHQSAKERCYCGKHPTASGMRVALYESCSLLRELQTGGRVILLSQGTLNSGPPSRCLQLLEEEAKSKLLLRTFWATFRTTASNSVPPRNAPLEVEMISFIDCLVAMSSSRESGLVTATSRQSVLNTRRLVYELSLRDAL